MIFNSATSDDDDDDDDDVELNVLGCRVDILGANCDQCVNGSMLLYATLRNRRTATLTDSAATSAPNRNFK